MLKRQYKYTLLWGSEQLERKFGEKHLGLSLPGNFNLSQWNKVLLHCLIYFLDSRAWPQTDITLENNNTRYILSLLWSQFQSDYNRLVGSRTFCTPQGGPGHHPEKSEWCQEGWSLADLGLLVDQVVLGVCVPEMFRYGGEGGTWSSRLPPASLFSTSPPPPRSSSYCSLSHSTSLKVPVMNLILGDSPHHHTAGTSL